MRPLKLCPLLTAGDGLVSCSDVMAAWMRSNHLSLDPSNKTVYAMCYHAISVSWTLHLSSSAVRKSNLKLQFATYAQIPLHLYLAQNLLKTRSPTCFEQVSDMSQTSQRPKKVWDLVSNKIDLSRHVEIDLAGLRHVCDFFCRNQVLSKIEAVEFRNDKRTFRGSQPISSHLLMT